MQYFIAKPTDYNVTVLICTYNSAKRIRPTLEHLKSQKYSNDLKWEIIIVDYLSADKTTEIAKQIWQDMEVPLTIISESRPGKTPALETGMQNARGEAICIIDDDNWADENYILVANKIIINHPDVGVVGAYGKAFCEVDPPSWFSSYQGMYAVGPQASKSGYMSRPYTFWGAGSVIRKSAWLKAKEKGFIPLLNPIGGGDNRFQQKSTGGEDPELCYTIQIIGYKLWYESSLIYTHYISAKRLTVEFIANSSFGVESAAPFLAIYLSYLCPKTFFGKIRKLVYTNPFLYLLYTFLGYVRGFTQSFLSGRIDKVRMVRLNNSFLARTLTTLKIFWDFKEYKAKIQAFAESSKNDNQTLFLD